MTAAIIPIRPTRYRPPFVTVGAAQHMPRVATSHTSTPEAARAACRWMAAHADYPEERAFWNRYASRRQYGQEMHQ